MLTFKEKPLVYNVVLISFLTALACMDFPTSLLNQLSLDNSIPTSNICCPIIVISGYCISYFQMIQL